MSEAVSEEANRRKMPQALIAYTIGCSPSEKFDAMASDAIPALIEEVKRLREREETILTSSTNAHLSAAQGGAD